jgi:hypothetical protein
MDLIAEKGLDVTLSKMRDRYSGVGVCTANETAHRRNKRTKSSSLERQLPVDQLDRELSHERSRCIWLQHCQRLNEERHIEVLV